MCSSDLSPANRIGLHLHFFAEDDGSCTTEVSPGELLSGFPGILHGGIASTILDELAFWTVFMNTGRFGLTARLAVKYREAVPVGRKLKATCRTTGVKGKVVTLTGVLCDSEDGREYVTADATYIIVDRSTWQSVTGAPVHDSIASFFPEETL